MRTSLNELKAIEAELLGKSSTADRLLFEARLITEPALLTNVEAQQQAYKLIKSYGRQQLKARLEAVHQDVFTASKYNWWRRLISR